jgi:hypothetical protein
MGAAEFDLDALRLTPEKLAELQRKALQTKKSKSETFVKLPYRRTLAAAGRLGDAPMAVMVELAHQAFRTHRKQVPLGNAALRAVGVSHDAKVRALRRLEADGMIALTGAAGGRRRLSPSYGSKLSRWRVYPCRSGASVSGQTVALARIRPPSFSSCLVTSL